MSPDIITKSLEKSIDYAQYRILIKNLILEGKSTGNEQTESRFEFSKLNDRRMDRLDKTLKIDSQVATDLSGIKEPITLLVIAEGWCGDAAQVLPVVNKLANSSELITMRIVLRDANVELMDEFLTNGSRSIPKVIILNAQGKVRDSWGPRPSEATKLVMDYKKLHGKVDDLIKKELQLWYNKDKGFNTQEDLLKLLKAS